MVEEKRWKKVFAWMDGWREAAEATHGESYTFYFHFHLSLSLSLFAADYYAIFERTFLFLLAIDRIVGNLFFRALKVFETFSFGSFHNRYSDLRIGSFCRSGRLSPTCVCLLGHLYDTSLLAKLIFPSVYNFLHN